MKPAPSYPFWLSAFMLLGPFLIISGAIMRNQQLVWMAQILGAGLVVVAFFYLSKRLHEQIEEVASLREDINKIEAQRRASTE
jgi:hypothetical protein